jgi:hypothetical protein
VDLVVVVQQIAVQLELLAKAIRPQQHHHKEIMAE